MRQATIRTCSVLVILTLAAALATANQAPPEGPVSAEGGAEAPEVHVVAPGDLRLRFDQEGRIDSASPSRQDFSPDLDRLGSAGADQRSPVVKIIIPGFFDP